MATKPKYVGDSPSNSFDQNLNRSLTSEANTKYNAANNTAGYAEDALNELTQKPITGYYNGFYHGYTPDMGTKAGKTIGGNVAGNSIPTSVAPTYYTNALSPSGTSLADALTKAGNAISSIGKASSGAGGGTGSGSGSGSADGANGAYAAYMQLAAAQMASQQARADQAAAAQRAAAQNAYDRGMSALANAYNNKLNVLNGNYDTTMGQLNNALNYSQGNVNRDADAALKQAYINRMMSERNLGQQLTAQGLTGGAAETTMARLLNNYGNSRNGIENNRANNLNELYNTYNNNVASANQAYNNALANAEAERMQYAMNLENALANNQIATEQSYQNALTSNNNAYLNALADAVDMMNRYNYTKSAATNDVNLATVIQNAVNGGVYNRNPQTGAVEQAVRADELEQANNNAYINALLKSMYGV